MIDRIRRLVRRGVPHPADVAGAVQTPEVVARLGALLGPAFVVCFATGLISHNAQSVHGIWLRPWPTWGYRVSQGIHVGTGIACLPLLLAKLFAAYPRILDRPKRSSGHRWLVTFLLEKGFTLVLAVTGIVEVSTGLFNIFQWYAFRFAFVPVHFAVAWVAVGAIMIHVAIKLPTIRSAFARPTGPSQPKHRADADVTAGTATVTSRRGFLVGVVGIVVGLALLTLGQAVGLLDRLALLAPRRPRSANVQGVPVNRTAEAAAVTGRIAGWQLTLRGPDGELRIDRTGLARCPQLTVTLPIACVEGWSVSADWSGVPVAYLLGLVGGAGHDARVVSMERGSPYATTRLPKEFIADHRTILALGLNGEPLDLDHGYPARIIAPNRPGVLQTKWVERIEVV